MTDEGEEITAAGKDCLSGVFCAILSVENRSKKGEPIMLAYTYIEQGKFELREKPKPVLQNDTDAGEYLYQ